MPHLTVVPVCNACSLIVIAQYLDHVNVRLVGGTSVEWRFFIEVSGEQCVLVSGICLMLQWYVESWSVENLLMLLVMLTLDQDEDQFG